MLVFESIMTQFFTKLDFEYRLVKVIIGSFNKHDRINQHDRINGVI